MKHPAAHTPTLHTWPWAQLEPLGMLLQAVVLDVGWQLWQLLAGFAAPEPQTVPLRKQPEAHVPLLQTSPAPQLVPFVMLLQNVVLAVGWQLRHGLAGFTVPDE